MTGSKVDQEIIGLYNKDITALYSINEIAGLLDKSYPYVNKRVTNLIERGILKKTIVGRSHLCTINLDNDEAILLLSLNETRKPKAPELKETIEEMRKEVAIHLVLRVKDRTIIVTEEEEDKKTLGKSFLIRNLKPEFYTREDFLKAILDDPDILRDHVIVFGYERYFQYLKLVERRLRIRYSPLLK